MFQLRHRSAATLARRLDDLDLRAHVDLIVLRHLFHPQAFGGASRRVSHPLIGVACRARLVIVALCCLAIARHFGDVSHVVYAESVLGIELVGLLEELQRSFRIVVVDGRHAAQVQPSYLRVQVFSLGNLLIDRTRIFLGHLADRSSPPLGIGRHQDRAIGVQTRGRTVIAQRGLQIALLLHHVSHVV